MVVFQVNKGHVEGMYKGTPEEIMTDITDILETTINDISMETDLPEAFIAKKFLDKLIEREIGLH